MSDALYLLILFGAFAGLILFSRWFDKRHPTPPHVEAAAKKLTGEW